MATTTVAIVRALVLAAAVLALVTVGGPAHGRVADLVENSDSEAVSTGGAGITRYVSPSGSDSNPGTLKRPWRTIVKAMSALGPGGTAFLRAGTYRETMGRPCGPSHNALNWRRSGRPSGFITIAGYPGEKMNVVVATKINLRGDYLRLRNLVLDRNASHSSFDDACTGSVNVAVYGRHVDLVGLEVRNAAMSGVYVSEAEDVRVLRSWIHDNGTHKDKDHGLYIESVSRMLLANSIVDDNLAYGVHLYPDETYEMRVLHNTVVGNGRSGLVVSGNAARNTFSNNIFAFNREYGVREFELGGTENVAVRNLFHGNGTEPVWLPDEKVRVAETILGDPRFVNRELGDYRLRPGSAALGRALATFMLPRDITGQKRPRGTGPDLGAVER